MAKDMEAGEIVRQALERYSMAESRERTNIEQAYDDLEFRAGEQWPDDVRKEREDEKRPCLTINHMPKFIRQVTGDIRMSRPSIRVMPADDKADRKTAETYAGLIRWIENRSDAQSAYFTGLDSQVAAGIGHWQVITQYASEDTLDQDIAIYPIRDGVAVLWDPSSVLPTREDAKWCIVPEDMTREDFKATYPNATTTDFDDASQTHIPSSWWSEDMVRIAHYWVKKPIKKRFVKMPEGGYAGIDNEEIVPDGVEVVEREVYEVCRYLITASEVLEGPTIWPGRYIPIVPALGEEIIIGKRTVRHGLIRFAKEIQRVFNYTRSTQTEVSALQPKSPWLVTEENVVDYADEWEIANTANLPYLRYKPDPANGNQSPQRIPPPVQSPGLSEAVALAMDDLKSATGLFDASIGSRSNETSGKAILARQREGDVSTFVYVDNFNRAVRHTGKILVDLIPKIYDAPRTLRILGDDGKEDLIQANKLTGYDANGQGIYSNDLTVGTYDVILDSGPSYTTKREEAREGMQGLINSAPDTAPMVMDLLAKALDWPMADKIAKRFEHMLPPAIKAMEAQEAEGAPPGIPPQMTQHPAQPDMPPEAQMAIQLELQGKEAETAKKIAEARKADADARAAEAKAMQEEFKAQMMMGGAMTPAPEPMPF